MVFHSQSLIASLFLSYTLINLSVCLPPPQAYRPDSCQAKGNALQGAYPDYFISHRDPRIYLEFGSVDRWSIMGAGTAPAKSLLDSTVIPELRRLRDQRPGQAVPGDQQLHWPQKRRAPLAFDLSNVFSNPAFTYDIAYRTVRGYSDWIQQEMNRGETSMRIPIVTIKGAGACGNEGYGVVGFALNPPRTQGDGLEEISIDY